LWQLSAAFRLLPNSAKKNAFFDHLALEHDALRFRERDEEKLKLLKKRLGKIRGARVLEPGCGAGPLTRHLATWVGKKGWIEAFDPSKAMLALCREELGDCPNLHLSRKSCEDATFPEHSFDRVICFRVFPHFENEEGVLKRFALWLKPGGRLHIVHWSGREQLMATHRAHGIVADDILPPPKKFAAMIRRQGFEILTLIDDEEEIYIEARAAGKVSASG